MAQYATLRIRPALPHLPPAQVVGDQAEVFHQGDRVGKDVGIDPLKYDLCENLPRAVRFNERRQDGVVNVAIAVGDSVTQLAG